MIYFHYKYFVYFSFSVFLFSSVFSQSLQDLQKMRTEYEKFKKGEIKRPTNQNEIETENPKGGLPELGKFTPYSIDLIDDTTTISLSHFGYDFLTKRDTIKFWENLPTPVNYLLGPGDELIIVLWGETQLNRSYIINRNGTIYDEKVGQLNMMGKTIEEAEGYLFNQFGKVFSTLKSASPSTFIDISLGQLRSINVNFVGDLFYPGVYPLHPFSNVITGLIQAGGVDTTGSLRNIVINRDGKKHSTIDLYDYFLKGRSSSNIQLRDQDVILVPARESKIIIDSAVVRPGIYESIPGENINELIKYAGGLNTDASGKLGLMRIIPIELRNTSSINMKNYYIDYKNSSLYPIQNGDIITAESMFKTIQKVEIIGQVKKPGSYYYSDGMKVSDLIQLAGGFNDSTFLKSVYSLRAEVVRRNPDTRYEKVIEVSINNIINGDNSEDIELQNLDRFVVHANLNFFEKENLQIYGEVNIPGSYPLIQDNETLRSLLTRAGNLTSKALEDGISIYRDKKYVNNSSYSPKIKVERLPDRRNDNINNSNKTEIIETYREEEDFEGRVRVAWQNHNITLMAGDSIVVMEATRTINVLGEVYNPGLIEFREGKSLRYYINAAGGVSSRGNRNDVIVIYANGLVSPKRWYSSPRIQDGASIIINEKPYREPFDITQFATNWTSIISSVITAIILSRQIGA